MNHSSDKPRRTHRNTASFSSTLLDEIYNSIDRKDHKTGDRKVFDEKPQRKQSNLSSSGSVSVSSSRAAEPKDRRRMSLMSEFQDRDLFFFDSRKAKPRAISSCFVPDDHRKVLVNNRTAAGQGQDHELLATIKTKSTVYNKVYENLKKVKQPMSPGGRLSSFINSLFAKKTKKNVEIKEESKLVVGDPMQRTVRFHNRPPVVDRDDDLIIGKPTNRNTEEAATIAKHVFDDDNDDDDVDGFSDASSDLFELDHKTVFGKSRFCDELPVYEKTNYFVKNNRLIS